MDKETPTKKTNIIAALRSPFHIDNNELFTSVSVGIANYPNSAKDSINLRKNADIALYRAKQLGRNTYCFYNEEINKKSKRRAQLINDLQVAMQRQQLYCHYQPKYDLSSKKFVGVEALIRWQHPKLGLISPDEFIILAEETGLIHRLGEWILSYNCRQIKQWEIEHQFSTSVAINLSSAQFLQKNFITTIQKILKETQVNPKQLEFEITETALMEDKDNAFQQLNLLSNMGITTSIDDFGTGYSSLNYLHQLPVNYLKIDRSFVADIFAENSSAPIVNAIINLAHNLNLKVIGEGIETKEQLTFLEKQKCDYVQGYLLNKPLPPEAIIALHATLNV